jgi:hypothetical protein
MMGMMILSQLVMQQHEVLELTIRVDAERAFEAKAEMAKIGMVVVGAIQSEERPTQVVVTFGRQQDVSRGTPLTDIPRWTWEE